MKSIGGGFAGALAAGRAVTLAAALALVAASGLAAQGSSLERVEQLTRLGRTDEARAVLMEWWESGRGDASRTELQRGLWLRGRLTVDPVQAELDFQRLVVLYPRGRFTPDAILRLAQGAYAMGDEEGARRHVATLVRDYARSPARAEAEAWLIDAGPVPPRAGAAVVQPEEPVTGGRPAGARPTEAARPPAARPAEEAATEAEGFYFVQLGAFAEEERAMSLFEEVEAAGIQVRVVRVEGSRFLHVRFGRFVERADAVEELERLAGLGISAALVRDERPEQLVRG